jgi:hypothetical protein
MYAVVLETSGHNRRRSAGVHGRTATSACAISTAEPGRSALITFAISAAEPGRITTSTSARDAASAFGRNAVAPGPNFIGARATSGVVRDRHNPFAVERSPAP